MAYRKTEQVLLEIEARRARIVKAAQAIIAKHGAASLTSARVARRSQLSVGLIYKHFPDMDELRAHVFSMMLAHDLSILRNAADLASAIRAWAKHLSAEPRLTDALAAEPAYREEIKKELARMVRSIGGNSPALLAAIICGAVIEASRASAAPGDALTTTLLRAVGARVNA